MKRSRLTKKKLKTNKQKKTDVRANNKHCNLKGETFTLNR